MILNDHKCFLWPEGNENVVFYSKLWKRWAFKIVPAYMKETAQQPIIIIINNCPYCGVKLE